MSEMLERVAAAILERDCFGESSVGELEAMLLARAAIEAMREPTDAMVSAVDSDWGPQLSDNWREMIDAALGKVVA